MKELAADLKVLLCEPTFIGTILLIAVTAVVCCLVLGPSLEVTLPLLGLALSHLVLELLQRRSRR